MSNPLPFPGTQRVGVSIDWCIIEELVPDSARSRCSFNHIAEKEKEDTESRKINELYEFSNDSSRD